MVAGIYKKNYRLNLNDSGIFFSLFNGKKNENERIILIINSEPKTIQLYFFLFIFLIFFHHEHEIFLKRLNKKFHHKNVNALHWLSVYQNIIFLSYITVMVIEHITPNENANQLKKRRKRLKKFL